MYASNYIFSKAFFTAWLVIAIIWLWCTLLIAGLYPIIDGRKQLLFIWKAWRRGPELARKESSDSSPASTSIATPPLKTESG